jgi:hypothetical protein
LPLAAKAFLQALSAMNTKAQSDCTSPNSEGYSKHRIQRSREIPSSQGVTIQQEN